MTDIIMILYITIVLIICLNTAALFLASEYYGLLVITLVVIAILTPSFLSSYRKDGSVSSWPIGGLLTQPFP